MKAYPTRNTDTRKEPQKRALPPRHSFLTEAVELALQKQSAKWEPDIDASTVLCITNETHHDEPSDPVPEYNVPTIKPVFTVADKPPRRPRIRSQPNVPITEIEPVPEDFYLKRHRKHEKEEKKLKNREKERLQHEMYQQQQFVERVRHTDKSIIMAIATALRQQQGNADESLPDVDVLYRQVLHDAEEHLQRYEMLGLARKSRKEETKSPPMTTNTSPSPPPAAAPPPVETAESAPAFRTFYTNAAANAAPKGARRSARNILAFGQRIPSMRECDFHLPMDVYGGMMEQRVKKRLHQQFKRNKKNNSK
ncbi:hypothetical protein BJV82DRAFT_220870 [Fennellomyces sp. T-0311]|nr:hypothetical protein BJV82DRAFT_220870 [Fennellomyces sp. T-0311]